MNVLMGTHNRVEIITYKMQYRNVLNARRCPEVVEWNVMADALIKGSPEEIKELCDEIANKLYDLSILLEYDYD